MVDLAFFVFSFNLKDIVLKHFGGEFKPNLAAV